jgi:hypothetical protein
MLFFQEIFSWLKISLKNLFMKKNRQKSFILIVALIILGLLLFLGTYFISFNLSESKISNSYEITNESYYLSEAGINEAIWKLKNDEIGSDGDDMWKKCFTGAAVGCGDCNNWSDTFFRNYNEHSTTVISISNSECGTGEVIATTTISFSKGKIAQRVVKVKVFKTIGSLTKDSPFFTGSPSGVGEITASNVNIYNGNLLGNGDILIKSDSIVNVFDNQGTIEQEGQILCNNNVNLISGIISASSTCAKNTCTALCDKCPSDNVAMPAIDFDSASSTSYKNKALEAEQLGMCSIKDGNGVLVSNRCIFTSSEFEDLLWGVGQNGKLILENTTNGNTTSIYYVEGGIDLKGAINLEIHGVLLADGTVNIGEQNTWKRSGQTHSGKNQITIIDPGANIPSGLLTKSKMNFGPYSSFQDINIAGLIYSQDELKFNSISNVFNLTGAIIGRKIYLNSLVNNLNLYLDNDMIIEGVCGASFSPSCVVSFSPIVTIEHWEESY